MTRLLAALLCSFALPFLSCAEAPAVDNETGTDSEALVSVQRAADKSKVVVRVRVKGAMATASAGDEHGQLGFDVSELTSSTNGVRSVLNFARNWRDPSSRSCRIEPVCTWPKDSPEPVCVDEEVCSYTRHSWESFTGEIAPGSFRVAGSLARLNADLSRATVLQFEHCDADEEKGTVDCRDTGVTGTFAVTWTENGQLSTYESGLKEERRPHSFRRTRGETQTDAADVTGSALGYAFTEPGSVQRVRGASLVKEWTSLR